MKVVDRFYRSFINSISFSHCTNYLLTGGGDKVAKIFGVNPNNIKTFSKCLYILENVVFHANHGVNSGASGPMVVYISNLGHNNDAIFIIKKKCDEVKKL